MATDEGPVTFIMDAETAAYYRQKRREHNQTCRISEWLSGPVLTSKYHIKVRETAQGLTFTLHCYCGAKFTIKDRDANP